MSDYSAFKVLLDDPAVSPGLGFEHYASALADVVITSTPRFAIGIFGGWGSGKTTLMRAIERRLHDHEDVVTVWFNAWRYEREPHLIIPLLDILRESLDARAAAQTKDEEVSRTRSAAKAIASAGKALLAGVTLSAGVMGVDAQLELGKVMEALAIDAEGQNKLEPLSFYHAAFVMLRKAIDDFSESGARRVVVFIDDLDRCLPENALEVLESMKLFFDMEGFIFVTGLDQAMVDAAVASKYKPIEDVAQVAAITGTNYIKKVFQVPFALPRISTIQLNDYLDDIIAGVTLVSAQQEDFNINVRPHLEFLTGEESVNPREVKRLVNAYTMQLKMLSRRLDKIDPNVVLALQCMSFRPEWAHLYENLVLDPTLFQQEVTAARQSDTKENSVWLAGRRVLLPPTFIRYIDDRARPLLTATHLELYVSAVESGRTTDPSLLEAQGIVARLRRQIEQIPDHVTAEWFIEIQGNLQRDPLPASTNLMDESSVELLVRTTIKRSSTNQRGELESWVKRLEILTGEFPRNIQNETVEGFRPRVVQWIERARSILDNIDAALRELRRQTSVGATSAS